MGRIAFWLSVAITSTMSRPNPKYIIKQNKGTELWNKKASQRVIWSLPSTLRINERAARQSAVAYEALIEADEIYDPKYETSIAVK